MRKTTRRAFLAKSGALAAVGIASPGAIQRALAGTAKATMVFRNGAVLSFKNHATGDLPRDPRQPHRLRGKR